MSKWISVKDKLPPVDVVVALHGGDIEEFGLKTTAGYWSSHYRCFEAIMESGEVELCEAEYWQPLPDPPITP